MEYFKRLLKAIDDGKSGLNTGIPTGFTELDYYLGGLRKKKYILVGSNTGVGKTAFVDYAFIISPLFWLLDNPDTDKKIKVFYYSFEIDIESKLVKWASLLLYLKTNTIVDPELIISAKRNKINKTEVEKIPEEIEEAIKLLEPYYNYIEENIEIFDYAINPTGIYKQTKSYLESTGKFEPVTKIIEGKEKKIRVYVPNNPNQITILVVDHYGLIKSEQIAGTEGKSTKKQSIDKLDEYCIELRNTYQITPILISQFNRDIADITRIKLGNVKPNLEDFKESGNTQEAADIVLAPFYPSRYDLPTYKGYVLGEGIGRLMRFLYILKNRGAKDNICVPMRFLGECGYFEEVPNSPDDIDDIYTKIKDFKNKIR